LTLTIYSVSGNLCNRLALLLKAIIMDILIPGVKLLDVRTTVKIE